MNKHKKPLNRSIMIGSVIFFAFLCIVMSFTNYTLYRNYVYEDYQDYIRDILNYTLSHIDGDNLRVCIDTVTESEKYKETLLFMDDYMEHIGDIHYFYAVLPLNTNDTGNVMSVLSAERYYDRYVDTEGNLYLGWISDDEYDAETAQDLIDIMEGDDIVFFEEKTEWGTDYTGAVPIKDSLGDPVAVLAVDIDISFLQGLILRNTIIYVAIVSGAGLMFIILFIIWSRRNITRPIKALAESAEGFVDHSSGQRDVDALRFEAPAIDDDNEVKALSDAIVKMTEDMREYVADVISAEQKAANMQELANRDSLTGIRNKTAYDNEIKRIAVKLEDGEIEVGLAMVDLNFLKKINDTYGHDKGDKAIKKLCGLICVIFDHSPVFRIGGDEFVIILRGNDYNNYNDLEKQFEAKLADIAKDDSLEPWEKVSASMGAAFYDSEIDEDMDSLFKRADHTMYEKKLAMKAARTD